MLPTASPTNNRPNHSAGRGGNGGALPMRAILAELERRQELKRARDRRHRQRKREREWLAKRRVWLVAPNGEVVSDDTSSG